uniref:Uncharacterized protein n=1 Tax=Opuntia streptacantha TaxID=393608 RepID=A0A7C9AE20_OPUST
MKIDPTGEVNLSGWKSCHKRVISSYMNRFFYKGCHLLTTITIFISSILQPSMFYCLHPFSCRSIQNGHLNGAFMRVGGGDLNAAIINTGSLQSRKQMLNSTNRKSILTKRGTKRRFLLNKINGSLDSIRTDIEVPSFSGDLRPNLHRC